MTPVELSRTVLRAVRRAVEGGQLGAASVPERVLVTVPGPGGVGDYATNVALQIARPAGRHPLQVAAILRAHLQRADGIADVSVTGPGFLNFRVAQGGTAALVDEILRSGRGGRRRYGHRDARIAGSPVRLRAPHEVRALVVMGVVAELYRSQGAADVRTACTAPPETAWCATLAVRVDDIRPASAEDLDIRPVPAPADPVPLGRDAGRWALLRPAAHDLPRIGGEHLVQREGNPLFRVRYAYARVRAVSRNASDLGFAADPADDPAPGLTAAPAKTLLALLADHPRVLASAAEHRAPDRLARQLVAVADAVTAFLPAVLPLGGEKPSAAHRARLALAEAAGTVLAGGLDILGIEAPDHL